MKKFRIEYYKGDRSKPVDLTELSKNETNNGAIISIHNDGKKFFKGNFKNGLRSGGAEILWYDNVRKWYFRNWKKGKPKGIQIEFDTR